MKNLLLIFLIPLLANCQTNQSVAAQFSGHVNTVCFSKKQKDCNFKNKEENTQNKNFRHSVAKNEKFAYQFLKHDQTLKNFEKQNTNQDFAENINFKSKVAKVRNKDYLDFI